MILSRIQFENPPRKGPVFLFRDLDRRTFLYGREHFGGVASGLICWAPSIVMRIRAAASLLLVTAEKLIKVVSRESVGQAFFE